MMPPYVMKRTCIWFALTSVMTSTVRPSGRTPYGPRSTLPRAIVSVIGVCVHAKHRADEPAGALGAENRAVYVLRQGSPVTRLATIVEIVFRAARLNFQVHSSIA